MLFLQLLCEDYKSYLFSSYKKRTFKNEKENICIALFSSEIHNRFFLNLYIIHFCHYTASVLDVSGFHLIIPLLSPSLARGREDRSRLNFLTVSGYLIHTIRIPGILSSKHKQFF